MLKLVSLFSGIGAFEKAFKRQNIPYKLVGFSEIDKYAIQSYCAIHNESEDKNLGDVSTIDYSSIGEVDVIVGGSPCQDFSVAGKQGGSVWACTDCGEVYNPIQQHYSKRAKCIRCDSENLEKTRSSLLIEYLRAIREKKPKYLIYENVKNIVGKKFKDMFDLFEAELQEYGYETYYQVLNAKHYGIPQNRERVYVIGIRKDVTHSRFEFPKSFDSGLRLKDFLEQNVDEKYYINPERTKKLLEQLKPGVSVYNQVDGFRESDVSCCIDANYYKGLGSNQDKTAIVETNDCICVGRAEGITGHDYLKRVYSPEGCSPTIPTCCGGNHEPKIIEDFYANREVREYDDCPTIRADRQGLKVVEGIQFSRKGTSKIVGECNTLTAQDPSRTLGNHTPITGVLESSNECKQIGSLGEGYEHNNRVYSDDGISPCVSSREYKDPLKIMTQYKIRKLTEIECYKLMGFDKEDALQVKSVGVSNTQMYKCAGNSIVVNVLEEIFKNLFNK